jgi:CubicO group peptidase (beta-lactamase class C family)
VLMGRVKTPILALGLLVVSTVAQADRVDDFIQKERRRKGMPGCAVAVLKDGRPVKVAGYGFANFELKVKVTKETVFQVPGLTPQFAAAAVLLLVEDGKVKLDDSITKYIENSPEAWKAITVRHLLTQTSGLKDFQSEKLVNTKLETPASALLQTLYGKPFNATPGAWPELNNSNEFLLRVIVAKTSGKSYLEFLQQRFFKPLGMTHTLAVNTVRLVPNRASGYRHGGELVQGEWKAPVIASATGEDIGATITDAIVWVQSLLKPKVLKQESYARMLAGYQLANGQTSPYHMGWYETPWMGRNLLWMNTNSEGGFETYVAHLPEEKLTVIVLANLSGGTSAIGQGLLGLYTPSLQSYRLGRPKKNDPAPPDEIDKYVLKEMEKEKIPGLALAVVQDGKVVRATGYGVAQLDTRAPVTPETVFRLASVSKQFTAAGILLLVEDGKVGLDEKISKYLPDTPETWKEITVRQLMNHTSGLIRDSPISDFLEPTDADIYKATAARPLLSKPGETWAYCNTGYFLQGQIIEKVSGKSYGEFLRERIFAPLGMNATEVMRKFPSSPRYATGYVNEGGIFPNAIPFLWSQASGGLVSNVLDLARWDGALLSEKVLKASSLKLAWSPTKLKDNKLVGYGFGWGMDDQRGHKVVAHGGYLYGFRSVIARYISDRITVIVLVNTTGASPEEIATGVARHVLPGLMFRTLKPQNDPDVLRTGSINQALREFAEEEGTKLLTSGLREAATPERKQSLANDLKGGMQIQFLQERDVKDDEITRNNTPVRRVRYYAAQTGKQTRYLTVYLTEEGKVADFVFDAE